MIHPELTDGRQHNPETHGAVARLQNWAITIKTNNKLLNKNKTHQHWNSFTNHEVLVSSLTSLVLKRQQTKIHPELRRQTDDWASFCKGQGHEAPLTLQSQLCRAVEGNQCRPREGLTIKTLNFSWPRSTSLPAKLLCEPVLHGGIAASIRHTD